MPFYFKKCGQLYSYILVTIYTNFPPLCRFCEMNTSEENNCSVAENIPLDEETVEEYLPVAIKQESAQLGTQQIDSNMG